MKIGEYEQMMAYLTRPGFKDGTEKIVEPPKSMQMDTTTSNPIPDYDINDFRKDAEIFVLAYHNNTLPRADIADKLNAFAQKGVDAGTFSMQDAGVMVRRLIGEVKDRAQKQRLRDVVPEGIGRKEFAKGTGGRPRADVPGLEEEVKKLFDQGLSTNQVLKNLKEKPEFEKVSEGVVKRIKKEFNLGAKSADLLSSQADKYNKLKELIEQSNNQLKFVDLRTLRERVGLPRKAAPTDKANMEKFNVPKLDSAQDKVRKGFQKIISNPNIPVEEVFDISTKIGQSTNLSPASVSQFLQDIPEYQDFKPTALKLQSPAFKAKIVNKNKTLSDIIEMADQVPVSGTTLSGANTPERFIINSVTRHINQGGDKVKWVKAPGTIDRQGNLITEADSVFRYKGKDYNYYDLVAKGSDMKEFKEVYETYDKLDDLLSKEVVDPTTKQKITFKELMQKAYNKGANFSATSNPYEIDHFDTVKNNPFSNLRILPYRINRVQGALQNKAIQAKEGFLKPETAKMYTPEKIKNYLQKSGYNFPKDPNKLFEDEVKLANDILVKDRKLKTPIQIGKDIEAKKFNKLLEIPGVTTASKIDRPQSALDRESFKRFNEKFKPRGMSLGAMGDIPMAKEILKKDFEKLKSIFGSKAARQIAGTTLKGAGSVYPFEMLFMGDMQQQGLYPKEMALDIGTLGLGTIFKDIKEKFDYVKSKGLGDELQSAFRKQTINQQARPTLGGAEGMFQEQTLTPDEEAALRAYNLDAQNIIDMRRSYQADEYRKTDEAFGFDDPMMRTGAMDGGIMRLGFADGPEDPSKRKFMKIMGGLASIPILGKFFKVAEKAAPLINKIKTPDAVGKPEWFDTLVNKVIQKGTDMTKQFATKEREIVYGTKISDDEYVRVVQDLDDDVVRIEYDSPTNVGQDTVVLQVKAGKMDEATGKKPRDEFQASEVEPAYVGGPEDTDMEFVGENSGPGIKFLESDVSNLQQFATGKKLTKEEAAKAKKRKEFVEKINEDNYEAAEHLAGKYGDGPEPDYDDFID